jgi:hypothetical protein
MLLVVMGHSQPLDTLVEEEEDTKRLLQTFTQEGWGEEGMGGQSMAKHPPLETLTLEVEVGVIGV